LPVTPSGPYVSECLLNRLKEKTGNSNLVPVHRIDRETAGLVLFSLNKETRGLYGDLFVNNQIEKSYEALAAIEHPPTETEWIIENRLEEAEPWFRMQEVPGAVNARSRIRLIACRGKRAQFALYPVTGKKHQLRVHMCGIGFPILNDRYYPKLAPKQEDDLENPLQLIARRLRFIDPVSGKMMEFESEQKLLF
jgi:tRNA pseudouridine32 synthase/23S rRNA pseudouridine746 synthase